MSCGKTLENCYSSFSDKSAPLAVKVMRKMWSERWLAIFLLLFYRSSDFQGIQ